MGAVHNMQDGPMKNVPLATQYTHDVTAIWMMTLTNDEIFFSGFIQVFINGSSRC